MDQFGRLPTDVQNYIKDFYQTPILSLKLIKNVDIQLVITYPHFTCLYTFNSAIDMLPELEDPTNIKVKHDIFYSASSEAYTQIKVFINALESNLPVMFNDNYDYYRNNICITVDDTIQIDHHNNRLILGIEHKDALIKVFKEFLCILDNCNLLEPLEPLDT